MTPFVADPDFTLFVGSAVDALRELPDESVHSVVTSPPYWGLRDYGTGSWAGGDPDCDHRNETRIHDDATSTLGVPADGGRRRIGEANETRQVNGVYSVTCGKCGATRTDQQLGLEPTPDAYIERMVQVFREVRRVLRRDGTCWLNIGDSYNAYNGNRGLSGSTLEGTDRPEQRPKFPSGRGLSADTLKPKDLVGIPWRLAFALQQSCYTGRIKNEKDRIWLAAMVEAEGCMFLHKRKTGQSNGQGYVRKNDSYGAGLEVSSTDRVIVERCMAIAGIGSICEQGPNENARRKQTIYRWNARTNACRDVIRELYPHMIAKQHEARLLLGCPSSGDDARKAWESLKAIHQGETATIDFAPPEGMWERGWFLRSEIIWAKLCRTLCPNPSPIVLRNRMRLCSC